MWIRLRVLVRQWKVGGWTPLVYNKEQIQKYWDKQEGVAEAVGRFFVAVGAVLTKVATLAITGGAPSCRKRQGVDGMKSSSRSSDRRTSGGTDDERAA